jgi:hypothetical protein
VRLTGRTIKLDGAAPKLHASIALIFTSCAISLPRLERNRVLRNADS